MAATETLDKRALQVALANGTTSTGAAKTVKISMGALDKNAWDATKAMNIVNVLADCLDKSIVNVPMTATYLLSD